MKGEARTRPHGEMGSRWEGPQEKGPRKAGDQGKGFHSRKKEAQCGSVRIWGWEVGQKVPETEV